MSRKPLNHIKLGIFVLAGLVFLIGLLYVIGKNQYLFGDTFVLKARFGNVNGLMPGNNIRFAGIDAGTVRSVDVINDTTVEVTLLVKTKMKGFIHKNATVHIGTDGLMGNKLVNIVAAKGPAPVVEEGDVLFSTGGVDTDEMLKVLGTTTQDIAITAKELKQTIQRINNSRAIWDLINDETLPINLRQSLVRINRAAGHMDGMMAELEQIVGDVQEGKGTIGALMQDTALVPEIKAAVKKIQKVGTSADTLAVQINQLVTSFGQDLREGQGTVQVLLKDKATAEKLQESLVNIEKGTRAFNDNMEAIRSSFLFRNYFRKRARQSKDTTSVTRRY